MADTLDSIFGKAAPAAAPDLDSIFGDLPPLTPATPAERQEFAGRPRVYITGRSEMLPSSVESAVRGAMAPITTYPQAYGEMRGEAQEQMSHGLGQITGGPGVWDRTKGVGNTALGAWNYTMSPLNAAVRTVVGNPLEATTGIPREYPEFAASLAMPVTGFTRIAPATTTAIKAPVAKFGGELEKIFSPDTVDAAGTQAAGAIRAETGGAARATLGSDAALEPFRITVNQMDDPSRLNLISHVEGRGGAPLPPDQQGLATNLQHIFEDVKLRLQALPAFQQAKFVDDYFPHFWTDPQAAQQFAANYAVGKQGSGASLKARSIPTIADGIAAGLTPVTTDPIATAMRYATSMNNFIASNKIVGDATRNGTIIYRSPKTAAPVGGSGNPAPRSMSNVPDGYVPLIGRGSENALGEQAFAPEGWARVYNNWLSPGFQGAAGEVMDTARRAANAYTAAELGFSGFHSITMAKDAIASAVARGVSELRAGRPVDAAKSFVKAPGEFVTRAWTGGTLKDVYLGRAPGTPEQTRVMDLLTAAGGRGAGMKHAADYEMSGAGSYYTAWKRGALKMEALADLTKAKTGVLPAAGVAGKQIGRIMDTIAQPLFEKYIPAVKNGVFFENMSSWLKTNPNAGRDEQVKAARQIWDSVDNRFGEMVQDNVFWDKTLKQTAMLLLRSWSWTVGGVARELGGGVRDSIRYGRGKVSPNGPHGTAEWTPKMDYLVGLLATDAAINAVYQYAKTGEAPRDIHDLIAGRTGGVDARTGQPERLQTPGFGKDIYGAIEHPGQEALNKLGTGPRKLLETGSIAVGRGGKDWRGDPIISAPARDEPVTNNVPKWLGEYAKFLAEGFVPISVKQYIQGRKQGSNFNNLETMLGVRAAPAGVTDPHGNSVMLQRMWEQADRKKALYEARQKKLYGGPVE